AGGGPGGVRRRGEPPDRAGAGRLVAPAVPGGGGGRLLPRRFGGGGAAVRGGPDAGGGGGGGARGGGHADPGERHRVRAPVEAGAAAADVADGGGDRRVLGQPQGDPPGDDRHVSGADDAPEGRLRPPGAVRLARLGSDPLRRGAPAAGADLPVHGGHPVAP